MPLWPWMRPSRLPATDPLLSESSGWLTASTRSTKSRDGASRTRDRGRSRALHRGSRLRSLPVLRKPGACAFGEVDALTIVRRRVDPEVTQELPLKECGDFLCRGALFEQSHERTDEAVVLVSRCAEPEETERIPLRHEGAELGPPLARFRLCQCHRGQSLCLGESLRFGQAPLALHPRRWTRPLSPLLLSERRWAGGTRRWRRLLCTASPPFRAPSRVSGRPASLCGASTVLRTPLGRTQMGSSRCVRHRSEDCRMAPRRPSKRPARRRRRGAIFTARGQAHSIAQASVSPLGVSPRTATRRALTAPPVSSSSGPPAASTPGSRLPPVTSEGGTVP